MKEGPSSHWVTRNISSEGKIKAEQLPLLSNVPLTCLARVPRCLHCNLVGTCSAVCSPLVHCCVMTVAQFLT